MNNSASIGLIEAAILPEPRRSARVCRIDRHRMAFEMLENPLNHCGFLDTGDHPQLPATAAAGLDVKGEQLHVLHRQRNERFRADTHAAQAHTVRHDL
jgi:hypothetical protein